MKVFKIGGNVVDNPELLEKFCRAFASIDSPKVLVHGGGVLAGKVQEAMGITPVKIEGRRVTDKATLRIVTMVYAGWCNKNIVATLQKYGCNAVGLSGCDGNVITAVKRPPVEVGGRMVDFGEVGDVTPASVNVEFLRSLAGQGFVPVLSAINHDGAGNLFNTNADTVASCAASALKASLVTCFEKKGVLLDVYDETSVIPLIDRAAFEALKAEGKIADGMIPKLQNAFKALSQGASEVIIKHSDDVSDPAAGTRIIL